MSWVLEAPTPEVLARARVACGWDRSGPVYRWAGKVGEVLWHLWVYSFGGRWFGSAHRWQG